jgi:hypothetical protein
MRGGGSFNKQARHAEARKGIADAAAYVRMIW